MNSRLALSLLLLSLSLLLPSTFAVSVGINWNFSPDGDRTIEKNTEVIWTNTGGTSHSVVSDGGVSPPFSSPSFGPAGTFAHTFDTVGSFPYHCGIHPSMTGTITVIEATSSSSTSEPASSTSASSTSASSTTTTATPTPTVTPTSAPVEVDWNINSADVTINAAEGKTVKWTNTDTILHTVTSDSDSGETFDSGDLSPGDSFEHVFDTAGTFGFHCTFHSSMKGKVVVGGSSDAGKVTTMMGLGGAGLAGVVAVGVAVLLL